MNSVESKGQFNLQRVIDALRVFVGSNYFPFVTAVITLFCYYMALDLVLIWYIALVGAFIFIFMRDTTPLITVFLFMNIMISMGNSPTHAAGNDNDYYFQTPVLAQIGVAVGLFAVGGIYRAVVDIKNGNFKVSPTFFGLCVFAVCLVLNGVLSDGYSPMNAVYGFILAFLFLGLFVACFGSVTINGHTYKRIAWAFFALSVCVVIELIVAYCTYDKLWTSTGGIDRNQLYFGWGIYNTIGMLFTVSMPSAAYLARRYRRGGHFFTVYLVVLLVCAFLSMSRQAMLCGSLVFLICAAWILIKCPERWLNAAIFVGSALVAVIVLAVKHEWFGGVASMLFENFFYGSGRSTLYENAIQTFMANPVFGDGFYRDLAEDPGAVGVPLVPDMYHNTILELMAVGGLVATIPYVIHRVHTVISFIKNPNENRFYVALTLFALLILSLLDNHIFYILPTLFYTFLTAVLIKSETGNESVLVDFKR